MPLTQATNFLRAVLPEQGYKVATVKRANNSTYNIVTSTVEELARAILIEDTAGNTVYHACASYKEYFPPQRGEKQRMRTHANAWGARSFWFDVDAGAEALSKNPHAHVDAAAAAQAVVNFCAHLHLPVPLFVGSGVGIHCYLPLIETLDPATWLQYATGLKFLLGHHGVQADPTRTADIASILRTPGTHHRKHGIKPVQGGPLVGPYPVAEFKLFLAAADSAPQPRAAAPKPASARATTQPLLAAMANTTSYEAAYCENVANRCAQVAQVRDTKGNVAEPHWYAALGVLSRCADGETFAHEWSKGHPNYSEHETNERYQRTLQLTGATTCAKLESVNPNGCAQCPFRGKITSPVALGRSQPQQPPTVVVPDPPDKPLPALPEPWRWGRNKELLMVVGGQDRDVEMLISQYPIYLESVQVGEVSGSKFSYLFRQFLPQRGWIDISIPAKILMGQSGLSELFDKGATIHDSKAFVAYVRYAVDRFHAENKLRTRYDQFGWKDGENAFLYGASLYTAATIEPALGSEEIRTRTQWMQPAKGGSIERWRAAANSLFAVGCEAQSFALLASFAAPLMRMHSTDEGGAIVSLVSPGSGTGKTTSLAAVASVWGLARAFGITNFDTRVTKALSLGVLGNLPVVYDELQNRDPEIIREFVMTFTNGRDRMRGTADGEIRHTQASWQTLMISASNLSLVDILQSIGGVDAPSFRIVEFAAKLPANLQHGSGDRLKKELEANSGYAGDLFLRYLLQPAVLAWTKAAVQQWTQELWNKTGLSAQHRFWVRTLGSVAVAAAIVKKLDLLDFSPERIIDYATQHLLQYRDDSIISSRPETNSISALSEFLNEHVADVLVMPGAYNPGQREQIPLRMPMRRLVVRYEVSNQRILIAEKPLRDWLVRKELGARELIAQLRNQLICTAPRRFVTLGAGTQIPGGQIPCVEINAGHPALSGIVAAVAGLAAAANMNQQVQRG